MDFEKPRHISNGEQYYDESEHYDERLGRLIQAMSAEREKISSSTFFKNRGSGGYKTIGLSNNRPDVIEAESPYVDTNPISDLEDFEMAQSAELKFEFLHRSEIDDVEFVGEADNLIDESIYIISCSYTSPALFQSIPEHYQETMLYMVEDFDESEDDNEHFSTADRLRILDEDDEENETKKQTNIHYLIDPEMLTVRCQQSVSYLLYAGDEHTRTLPVAEFTKLIDNNPSELISQDLAADLENIDIDTASDDTIKELFDSLTAEQQTDSTGVGATSKLELIQTLERMMDYLK